MNENDVENTGSFSCEIPTTFDQFPRELLYSIWKSQNGYPRQISESEWSEYKNLPHYRSAVATDLTIYFSLILSWMFYTSGPSQSQMVIGVVFSAVVTFLVTERFLPRDVPVGLVGPFSGFAYVRGYFGLRRKVLPPPINLVHLDTFPVVVEAAKRIARPAISEIETTIRRLQGQLDKVQSDHMHLSDLQTELQTESERSELEWKRILEPKVTKIKKFSDQLADQLLELNTLKFDLEKQRDDMKRQLERLELRYELIKKVEHLEKSSADPHGAPTSSVNEFLQSIRNSRIALSEASAISTAHELAKVEMAEFLQS